MSLLKSTSTVATTDVKDLLDKALISLVVEFPIYAQLITRIGVKLVKSNEEYAAWTDGRAIYVNETAVQKFNSQPTRTGDSGTTYNTYIGPKEMVFIISHELMHLIGLTFDRGRTMGIDKPFTEADQERWARWNKATDYEINSLLHNNESTDVSTGDKKRAPVGNMPDWVLYESDYRNKTAEEIYKDLEEKEKKQPHNMKFTSEDGVGSTGNGKDGLPGLDKHIPIDDDDVRNEVISKIAEVYGSRTNGLGESGLDRLIERSFKPVPFNWKKALSKYMKKWIKQNYTWNKPSRAGIANNLILPSAGKMPKLNIGVAIDTSGSISDVEINTMMNHMFTILQSFKDFEIDLWCCGSQVYPETLLKLTGSNKRELLNFKVVSDGGNDMRKNFEFIQEHYKGKNKIDLLLVMTDGYDPIEGDTTTKSICPVIFLIIDHKDFKKPTAMQCEVYPFEIPNGKN